MKRYYIKTHIGRIEYFDILGENDGGYRIRLTKIHDGNEKTIEDSMSRTLLDVCLKTGYIYEMEEDASSVA
ncbi:MAG: hypothetical protein LBP71_04460 [Spirochaetaceae bacterium]|jgi:hypothetical protein|nr:hypothetical protein [Spirochaetaceae bacterium]